MQRLLREAERGPLRFEVDAPRIETLREELRASARRRDATLVAVGLLFGGLVWLAVGAPPVGVGVALVVMPSGYLLLRR